MHIARKQAKHKHRGVGSFHSCNLKMSENEDYLLVVDENGGSIVNEKGHVLIQTIADQTLMYIEVQPQNSSLIEEDTPSSALSVETNSLTRWTHDGILALIDEYQSNLELFQSSVTRNETVWKLIATNLTKKDFYFTSKQCEFKFKNLKKKYHSKVDNMKTTASGAAAIQFQYFDVVPLATASSSRECGIESEINIEDEDVFEEPESGLINQKRVRECAPNNAAEPKKHKKTKFELIFTQLENISKQKEEERNKRHKETLAVQESAIQIFSEKMDQLIKK